MNRGTLPLLGRSKISRIQKELIEVFDRDICENIRVDLDDTILLNPSIETIKNIMEIPGGQDPDQKGLRFLERYS